MFDSILIQGISVKSYAFFLNVSPIIGFIFFYFQTNFSFIKKLIIFSVLCILFFLFSFLMMTLESIVFSIEIDINNKTFAGGFFLLNLSILILLKRKTININNSYTIILTFLVMFIIQKLGCFFAIDSCYGGISNLPWAIEKTGLFSVKLNPLPIYESLITSIIIIIHYLFDRKKCISSLVILINIFLIFRFINFQYRPSMEIWNISFAQIVIILQILINLFYLINSKKQSMLS